MKTTAVRTNDKCAFQECFVTDQVVFVKGFKVFNNYTGSSFAEMSRGF